MNTTNLIILIVILLLAAGLLYVRYRPGATSADVASLVAPPGDHSYEALREQAFSLPVQAQQDSLVYGIVMDWHMGEGTITLVAFASGEASVYFSSGGGILGAQMQGSTQVTLQRYLAEAAQAYASARPTNQTGLPAAYTVQFYFLSKAGLRCRVAPMQYLEDRSSPLLPLFEQANELLVALRAMQEEG